MRFGAGRDVGGVVVMLTVGTGIGSALFVNGELVPNTELGHLEVDGHEAEHRASETVREQEGLSHRHWAKRFNRYLEVLEALLWPDLVIIGGGISKEPEKFMPLLESQGHDRAGHPRQRRRNHRRRPRRGMTSRARSPSTHKR